MNARRTITFVKLLGIMLALYVLSYYCWVFVGLRIGERYGMKGSYYHVAPTSREARTANLAVMDFYYPIYCVNRRLFGGPHPIIDEVWDE